jgi:tagatose 1,6-diphosphate aldolase
MEKGLSIGKIRGLQQITTRDGVFVISALDHRGSLKAMIESGQEETADYRELVEYKLHLCAAVAPHSTAVLLDPNYGAAQCISAGVLPGHIGLLVSTESTGYQKGLGGRVTTLLDGWSVDKIKRMGGSAAKILVYYRPDIDELARKQLETVKFVAEECIAHDVPFLVEPVSYRVEGESSEEEFARRKPEFVIETARQVTALPIDVLKAEFPANIHYEKDRGKLLDLCKQLDEATGVPWVVLSAGVDYEMFKEQVQIACQAGASGFLGGRAIWQESVHIVDKKERLHFLATTVADRLKELMDITTKYGVPWHRKLGLQADNLITVEENWYKAY